MHVTWSYCQAAGLALLTGEKFYQFRKDESTGAQRNEEINSKNAFFYIISKLGLLVSRKLRNRPRAICCPAPIRNMATWALREWEPDWEPGCSADAAERRPAFWQWLVKFLSVLFTSSP